MCDALLLFIYCGLLEDVNDPLELTRCDLKVEILELLNFSLCNLIALLLEGPTLFIDVVLVIVYRFNVLHVVRWNCVG